MNDIIRLQGFFVKQPIGDVFVTKIEAQDLLRLSSVDRRYIDEDEEILGIQRQLKPEKVREIKKYLTTKNATFPNSIIVNVRYEDVNGKDDNILEINNRSDVFTIIDGQHRLFGFEDYRGKSFELIVAIFIGLEKPLQAEVFSTINSQQTKVDPSLNINLILAEKIKSPKKVLVQIAQSFNIDKESPWYQQIRMLPGQGKGIISLSAFVTPLMNYTFPEREYINIKNRLDFNYPEFPDFRDIDIDVNRYPFWQAYISQNPAIIYKILLNFFSAFRSVLHKDWLNEASILNKTSGYNAMMKLFGILLIDGLHDNDLTEKYFYNKLSPLSQLSGKITAENFGSSGAYSTNIIFKTMKDLIYDNHADSSYVGIQPQDN